MERGKVIPGRSIHSTRFGEIPKGYWGNGHTNLWEHSTSSLGVKEIEGVKPGGYALGSRIFFLKSTGRMKARQRRCRGRSCHGRRLLGKY